jgi:hypothetical protein
MELIQINVRPLIPQILIFIYTSHLSSQHLFSQHLFSQPTFTFEIFQSIHAILSYRGPRTKNPRSTPVQRPLALTISTPPRRHPHDAAPPPSRVSERKFSNTYFSKASRIPISTMKDPTSNTTPSHLSLNPTQARSTNLYTNLPRTHVHTHPSPSTRCRYHQMPLLYLSPLPSIDSRLSVPLFHRKKDSFLAQ